MYIYWRSVFIREMFLIHDCRWNSVVHTSDNISIVTNVYFFRRRLTMKRERLWDAMWRTHADLNCVRMSSCRDVIIGGQIKWKLLIQLAGTMRKKNRNRPAEMNRMINGEHWKRAPYTCFNSPPLPNGRTSLWCVRRVEVLSISTDRRNCILSAWPGDGRGRRTDSVKTMCKQTSAVRVISEEGFFSFPSSPSWKPGHRRANIFLMTVLTSDAGEDNHAHNTVRANNIIRTAGSFSATSNVRPGYNDNVRNWLDRIHAGFTF